MTTENTAATSNPEPDRRVLLARINARLALLREWLSHHHGDEPYWWARQTTPAAAQRERLFLRPTATQLHVERATSRGRIHGTWFASLDEQRAWLEKQSKVAL